MQWPLERLVRLRNPQDAQGALRPLLQLGLLGSTSAMRAFADGGDVEQREGSFLHQRTHTFDPVAAIPFREVAMAVQRADLSLADAQSPALDQ
jgi:hypothetical protein